MLMALTNKPNFLSDNVAAFAVRSVIAAADGLLSGLVVVDAFSSPVIIVTEWSSFPSCLGSVLSLDDDVVVVVSS